jgi:uncharacterized protein
MIPSPEDCYKIMEKYGMLENIRAHSSMVEKVASIIGRGIRETGYDISMEKVSAGALMHDIGKTLCLNSNTDHAEVGMEICIQNDFQEIAEIVVQHIRLKRYDSHGPVCEKEIVYYADKRVNHDAVVSIEERLEYLLDRYAKERKDLKHLIMLNFNQCRDVERKIFSRLDFAPPDLNRLID